MASSPYSVWRSAAGSSRSLMRSCARGRGPSVPSYQHGGGGGGGGGLIVVARREAPYLTGVRPPEELDARLACGFAEARGEARADGALVHQQGLERVAGGRIVRLGVEHQPLGLGRIRGGIDVHVADAVSVAEGGDLCGGHDVLDHRIGATRDYQVDGALQLEKRANLRARLNEAEQ
eukprot:scaffold8878_cov27-Tisochrysis_lutea.AAC.4